jgi:Leucine-rich repeat (LRR) protein
MTIDPANTSMKLVGNFVVDYDMGKEIEMGLMGNLKGTLRIPSGATKVSPYAFCKSKYITALELPSSLSEIETGSFKDCINLAGQVIIPTQYIYVLYDDSFENDSKITSFVIKSNSVPAIKSAGTVTDAFLGCTGLTAIYVQPAQVSNFKAADGWKARESIIRAISVPVTGITVSPTSAQVLIDGTAQLTATVAPDDATNKTVTWSSSNSNIATVDATGLVTGNALGTATITAAATDGSGVIGTCTVTVIEPVIDIPDANFKAYLVANFDKNKDDEISISEAAVVTVISCDSKNISSLKGIEYFTALTKLYCSANQLTSLDLSKNTALTELSCYSNQLTSLDLSKNTALTYLSCSSNRLDSLDVIKNTALTKLYCTSNRLTSLDVGQNTALTKLLCFGNQLASLDVSKNTALTELNCGSNKFTSLDVSKNTALKILNCSSNRLTSLDLSNNTALTELNCSSNQLTSLVVSKNTALTKLSCTSNRLTSLDVGQNTALTELNCSSNLLSTLDASTMANPSSFTLYCGVQSTSGGSDQTLALTLLEAQKDRWTTSLQSSSSNTNVSVTYK